MTTVLQQVLDRVDAILLANTPPGTTLSRDRADPQSRDEAPGINVLAREGAVTPFSDDTDEHQVQIELRICVRDESGTAAAEALHAGVHHAIQRDAALAALCEGRRLADYAWERAEADATLLIKSARYRLTYLTPADTL